MIVCVCVCVCEVGISCKLIYVCFLLISLSFFINLLFTLFFNSYATYLFIHLLAF